MSLAEVPATPGDHARDQTAGLRRRRRISRVFELLCGAMTWVGVVCVVMLLIDVAMDGLGWLSLDFLTSFPSRFPHKSGIKSALWGTVWMITMTAVFSIPMGVAAAIYLEELARPSRLNTLIEVNIANLAGVPSIVYGIFGLVIFVRGIALGRSLLAGSLTMSFLILPIIIIASREAIRAVSPATRQAAFALGATRWQTVRDHVLPEAFAGILTGVILSLSRAMGETAPLIMIGALTYVPFIPEGPLDPFTTLPIQIFNWSSRPQQDFHSLAAAGILVLLVVLLLLNAGALYLRYRFQRRRS